MARAWARYQADTPGWYEIPPTFNSLCEWDPERNEPAHELHHGDVHRRWGCRRLATFVVGAAGQWRLCTACAALPQFGRFRKSTPILRAHTWQPKHGRRQCAVCGWYQLDPPQTVEHCPGPPAPHPSDGPG